MPCQWTLEDAGDGFVRIRNREGRGKYLCADGDAQNGTRAICSTHQQTWKIIPFNGESNRFRIVLSATYYVIDLDNGRPTPGAPVFIWNDNGGLNQVWIFEPVEA
ncbi:carbohydrate-binding module family 13 protein [Hydnum rufescens UP504]|uniref:Carbohydrate-binding module family 13 protein n=1 Tax=Hydnum rufescens UP504 TaxID=1448309 RepID=A0A9P6ATM5_9AGAM|nr:carbohydrate-binding module family 13 protein [Hydnum rufescens UP504]